MSDENNHTDFQKDIYSNYNRAFQKISDFIVGKTENNLVMLLSELTSTLGLSHITCLRFEANWSNDVTLLGSLVTYSKEWQMRYFIRRYHEIDPLFSACVNASAPFDWRYIRDLSPQSTAFFADAADHGVGTNGLTFPVRNKSGGVALVSFNSNLADPEWETFKLRYFAELQVLACLVDSAASRSTKLPSRRVELSKREHEALTWAARGKTGAEIANVMNVSYATVRTYIESSRRKLGCENVTHAVAMALAIGLIPAISLRGSDPAGYSGRVASAESAKQPEPPARPQTLLQPRP